MFFTVGLSSLPFSFPVLAAYYISSLAHFIVDRIICRVRFTCKRVYFWKIHVRSSIGRRVIRTLNCPLPQKILVQGSQSHPTFTLLPALIRPPDRIIYLLLSKPLQGLLKLQVVLLCPSILCMIVHVDEHVHPVWVLIEEGRYTHLCNVRVL